jgi:hypothetical protein
MTRPIPTEEHTLSTAAAYVNVKHFVMPSPPTILLDDCPNGGYHAFTMTSNTDGYCTKGCGTGRVWERVEISSYGFPRSKRRNPTALAVPSTTLPSNKVTCTPAPSLPPAP